MKPEHVNVLICLLLLTVVLFLLGYGWAKPSSSLSSEGGAESKILLVDNGIEGAELVENAELVKNYQTKKSFKHKVVMVIEEYDNNVQSLQQFLRRLLAQNVKVASLVLVDEGLGLDKIALIKSTCVINKVGGMSFLFKETNPDTMVVFVYASAFAEFQDPDFLEKFILGSVSPLHKHSIFKTRCGDVQAEIGKVYDE